MKIRFHSIPINNVKSTKGKPGKIDLRRRMIVFLPEKNLISLRRYPGFTLSVLFRPTLPISAISRHGMSGVNVVVENQLRIFSSGKKVHFSG